MAHQQHVDPLLGTAHTIKYCSLRLWQL